MRQHNSHKIIETGIAFLLSEQQTNGNFLSYYSAKSEDFSHSISHQTTFITSLILLALNALPETPNLKLIKQNSATFLLSQKNKYWSWNYWARESKEAKLVPYPDDLDDTFCALSALFTYKPKLIDGKIMSHIVNILTVSETTEGGPYKTWLVSETANEKWKDVDLAVNSNVAYFLYLHEIELPNVSNFITSRIKKADISSPYYPSSFPIIYFISRFYKNKFKKKIINHILKFQKKDYTFGNSLETALAITSLLNLGFPPGKLQKNVESLLIKTSHNNYNSYAFWLDPAIKNKKQFAGSKALTTAFCLETLTKYDQAIAVGQSISVNKEQTLKQEKIYNDILIAVQKRLADFDDSFQQIALILIKKLTKNNTDKQILLLPYYFAYSLGENNNKISDKLLIQLGTANIFGWIAYTIYDDFLDDEGDPKKLSLANVALRESSRLFSNSLPLNKKYPIFFQKIFDQIDNANYWEITNCRNKNVLPNYEKYEKLAEKSFGHSLGPLTILFSLGYEKNSKEVKQLSTFFKHLLIARQLNDDAHDWEKDLKNGHINPVVKMLLQKSTKKSSLKNLQKLFWEEIIDSVSLLVLKHVDKGKEALNKCNIIYDKSSCLNMIIKYEKIATKTLEEKKQTMKFLNTYKNE